VIVGAAGYTNLGDDAILTAMLGELREALPGAWFTVASGNPQSVGKLGVETIGLDTGSLDAALVRADLAIVGGGGFIYDYDGILSPHDFLRGDSTFMYPYYRAALCARARDVPLFFYALGVESLVTPVGRALARDVLSLADAITVRDALSLCELRGAEISAPIEVTADPAVGYRPSPQGWKDRPAGRVVAFVARQWLRFSGGWTESAEQYFDRYCAWLADGADHAVEQWDATPIFLAGQRYNDDDLGAAERIVARMRNKERAVVVSDVASLEQYYAVLASADGVVSARLHPIILAATAGVRSVGVVVSAKITAFLFALGMGELALSPWAASIPRLRAAIDTVLATEISLRARIEQGMNRQREAARRNPALAAQLLESRRS
jgi:polysaccharide pyruvyl transferase WcaK-like protein